MKTIIATLAAVALAGGAGNAAAGSRVIVSTTLNSTLQIFDAADLVELQPPLPSRGGGPVRLWIEEIDGQDYLLTANHGLVGSSVGVFDLSQDLVLEMPLSPAPAPAGFGAVGIAAGTMRVSAVRHVPMVFLGNTYFALAPCDVVPPGSVTAFDASLVSAGGLLTPVGTVDIAGGLAWGVSVDEAGANAFGVSNCADRIDTLAVTEDDLGLLTLSNVASRPTQRGPDGTMFDGPSGLNYTVNIGGDSVSVHDRSSSEARTTVSLKGGDPQKRIGPIDATFAEAFGKRWFVTSNGQDDSVGLVDREIVEQCVAASKPECPEAHVGNLATGEPDGAPEGVAFDPVSKRIFVVNKPIGNPSLSVIQLDGIAAAAGPAGYSVSASVAGKIPLTAAGQETAVPALIAFDVVVQPR